MEIYHMGLYDHVLAVIICILAPLLAFSSRRVVSEEIRLSSDDKIRLYHNNGLLLIVFGMVVATVWRIPGRPLSGLGIDLATPHKYVLLLIGIIFIFYFLDIFFQYGSRRRREKTMERRTSAMSFVPTDKRELLHFIFLALAAGIGEEIIFRGYLINYLLHWTGNEWNGVIIAGVFSSFLFAFLHGYQGRLSMIKIFFLALLFSALFIVTHSLLIVIIIHTVIDTLSGLLGIYLIRSTTQESK